MNPIQKIFASIKNLKKEQGLLHTLVVIINVVVFIILFLRTFLFFGIILFFGVITEAIKSLTEFFFYFLLYLVPIVSIGFMLKFFFQKYTFDTTSTKTYLIILASYIIITGFYVLTFKELGKKTIGYLGAFN